MTGGWQPVSQARVRADDRYELLFIDGADQICTMQLTGRELGQLNPDQVPLAVRHRASPERLLMEFHWDLFAGATRPQPTDHTVLVRLWQNDQGDIRTEYLTERR